MGLPDGEKLVKDRETGILPWHSPCYAYALHGKNYQKYVLPFALTMLVTL